MRLQKRIGSLAESYRAAAAKLTEKRTQAARQLAKRVEGELASLAMEKTRVEIRVEPAPWSEHGSGFGRDPARAESWAKSRSRWRKSLPAANYPGSRWR